MSIQIVSKICTTLPNNHDINPSSYHEVRNHIYMKNNLRIMPRLEIGFALKFKQFGKISFIIKLTDQNKISKQPKMKCNMGSLVIVPYSLDLHYY